MSSNNKHIDICIGVDVDAVAGWIGSYGGGNSPNDIQRGMFAGEVGSLRLLNLFRREGIKTSWFIPGHSLETFPDEISKVASDGHEIGAHGYSHENPVSMNSEQELEVLEYSIALIEKVAGQRPRGYVAPWWEMSERTADLLLDHGFLYDHSQNYSDFVPFYARVGDSWTNINFEKEASDWMKPLVRGREIELVEFCGNWYVDDLPPMMFIKQSPNSHGYVSPRDIEQLWKDQFDWVYDHLDYAVFPVTLHPDVSGRPQVLLMLERLFEYWAGHEGVRFVTFEDSARYFREMYPFLGSERPSAVGT